MSNDQVPAETSLPGISLEAVQALAGEGGGDASAPKGPLGGAEAAADSEIDQLTNTHLGDEAVAVRERVLARLSPEQKAQAAKKQRKEGRARLGAVVQGVPSVLEHVQFGHPSLAAIFERTFSTVNDALYLAKRNGERLLGERVAASLTSQLIERCRDSAETLEAIVAAVGSEYEEAKRNAKALDQEFVEPQIHSKMEPYTVQIKDRAALKLARVMMSLDGTLSQADAMHWNDLKSDKDISELTFTIKREMRRVAASGANTIKRIYAARVQRSELPAAQAAEGGTSAAEQ